MGPRSVRRAAGAVAVEAGQVVVRAPQYVPVVSGATAADTAPYELRLSAIEPGG